MKKLKKYIIKLSIRNILFPYFIKKVVGLRTLVYFQINQYDLLIPNSTFFSTIPIGFIIAEIPLLADLTIYFPVSMDLKIL